MCHGVTAVAESSNCGLDASGLLAGTTRQEMITMYNRHELRRGQIVSRNPYFIPTLTPELIHSRQHGTRARGHAEDTERCKRLAEHACMSGLRQARKGWVHGSRLSNYIPREYSLSIFSPNQWQTDGVRYPSFSRQEYTTLRLRHYYGEPGQRQTGLFSSHGCFRR